MHICICEYWLVQASHYSNKAAEYVEWNEDHKEQRKKNRANLYAKNNRHFFTTRNNVLQADTVLNPGIPLFRTKTTSPRDTLVLALTSIYQFLSHLYHRGYSLCPCFSLSRLSIIPPKRNKKKDNGCQIYHRMNPPEERTCNGNQLRSIHIILRRLDFRPCSEDPVKESSGKSSRRRRPSVVHHRQISMDH